jgi:hypothetical protein
MQASRLLGFAAVFSNGVWAGTIDSSKGNDKETPTPRKSVRREMCFLVINVMA